jgi:hypothetical protein
MRARTHPLVPIEAESPCKRAIAVARSNHALRCVARRRACPRVPARPKNVPVSYPRRIELSPSPATLHAHLQGFCASALTDSNRRPPPYHGGFGLLRRDGGTPLHEGISLQLGGFIWL